MKKRVLIFIPNFPVLTETFIEREVLGLIQSRKSDITILALTKNSEFRSDYIEKVTKYERLNFVSFLSGLQYFFISPKNTFGALKTVGFRRMYVFLKSLGYARIFSKYKPDILYAHFLSEPSTISMIAAKILNIPYGISAHARDVLEYPDLPGEKVATAQFITFCNIHAFEKAKGMWGNNKTNLYLSNHGVDSDDLILSSTSVLPKTCSNMIFCIGRLTEKKGINFLIEASEYLRDKNIDHCIYVAGGGELFAEYFDLLEQKSLLGHFTLLGNIPFTDIVKYLNLAKIYVQPSIDNENGDSDGVPNGLIEAALLEKPIITTNAGSISEFIDEKCGIIIPQKDAKSLAIAIEDLLLNEQKGKIFATTAMEKAKTMFNFADSIKRIEDLLFKNN